MQYENRIYEMVEAGTTASVQPAYDTAIGASTIDGTATLKPIFDSCGRREGLKAADFLRSRVA